IDSKTGVSGAGRSASVDKLLTELMGNFKAYNPLAHRHIPEIEQELNSSSKNAVQVQFTPHLLPAERGIFSTIYATVKDGITEADIIDSYKAAYENEPFVHVLEAAELPQMKHVAGTNSCQLSVQLDERTGRLLALSVIDNLDKGAAGQAEQNMNIMSGLTKKSELSTIAMMPYRGFLISRLQRKKDLCKKDFVRLKASKQTVYIPVLKLRIRILRSSIFRMVQP